MDRSVFILCGGFGTRLRSVLADVPKPLAPVRGRPFLSHLLDHAVRQGACDFVLCLHHLPDQFIDFAGQYQAQNPGVTIRCSLEPEPLGTGGAIRFALEQFSPGDEFFIMNGDTLTKCSLVSLDTGLTGRNFIGLVEVPHAGRYGRVETDAEGRILSFVEKGAIGPGRINSGCYRLVRADFERLAPQGAFSIEREFLPNLVREKSLFGIELDLTFIDIGIPEDYARMEIQFESIYPSYGNCLEWRVN